MNALSDVKIKVLPPVTITEVDVVSAPRKVFSGQGSAGAVAEAMREVAVVLTGDPRAHYSFSISRISERG